MFRIFRRFNIDTDCSACGTKNSLQEKEISRIHFHDSSVIYPYRYYYCSKCGVEYAAGKLDKSNTFHREYADARAMSKLYDRVKELEQRVSISTETLQ